MKNDPEHILPAGTAHFSNLRLRTRARVSLLQSDDTLRSHRSRFFLLLITRRRRFYRKQIPKPSACLRDVKMPKVKFTLAAVTLKAQTWMSVALH